LSQPDPAQMMQRAREMQEKLAEMQQQLALKRFEASSGGGMVKAAVSGDLRVLKIEIEPSLLEGGDRDMIGDLTAAAVNAALSHAQQSVQQELQRFQANLLGGLGAGLPGPGI